MNIIALNKLLKFRLYVKKALSNFIEPSKIYAFGSTESIKKLLSFKDVNFIITDEETAFYFKDFLLNLYNRNDEGIHLVIFYFSRDFEKNKSTFKHSSFIYLNPDFDYNRKENILSFSKTLEQHLSKIKKERKKTNPLKVKRTNQQISKYMKAVLIGVSTGGPKALRKLLPELTSVTKLPIIIVQHILKNYTDAFVNSLNSISNSKVLKIENGLTIANNYVYVAPGGIHSTVVKNNGKTIFQLDDSPPEESVKPSVNYLFRSAADVYRKDTIAVILTGMGHDGTDGARKLSQNGAYIIAQDEASSDVWSMPHNAIQKGCINMVLPLSKISSHISSLLNNH